MLCTGGVEQLPLKLFVIRLAKDLLGLRGNGVRDSPISDRMPTSLTTVTWGSILRHAGRQESVAYDRGFCKKCDAACLLAYLSLALPLGKYRRLRAMAGIKGLRLVFIA